jgi:hypothetical protein
MVYAYNPGNATLSFHHRNYGFFNIKLDSATGSCTLNNKSQRIISVHAWLMWLSWTVIAMSQIIVNRYCKTNWRW